MRKVLCLFLIFAFAAGMSCAAAEGSQTDVFTVDLYEGMAGSDVEELQRLLKQYGFYTGAVDGQFGSATTEAVKDLERYLTAVQEQELALEQEALTPTPAPTQEPAGEEEAEPEATLSPTPMPKPYSQSGKTITVDGIAELSLLRQLEYGMIDFYVSDVEAGKKNPDAKRAQTRLISLNYLDGSADGVFGENSMAAMRQFQRDNGLEITGLPNGYETNLLLYDRDARAADHPVFNMLLSSQTENDDVLALQQKLNTLGFTYEVPDGIYGINTEKMLTTFKTYMFEEGLMNADNVFGGAPVLREDGTAAPLASTTGAWHELQQYLRDDMFPAYRETLDRGNKHTNEVLRLQRRLYLLGYLLVESRVDGDYGDKTVDAVSTFQRRNGLPVTGVADEATQRTLFSENCKAVLKPYLIKVSLDDQRAYVYSPDENEEYTVLEHTFVVSTGVDESPTPTGTFSYTGKGERWHYFEEFNSWAQYAFHIDGGIMFHSVIYDKKDVESSLQYGTLKALGYKASHGCVRMQVEDAKWIWENCPTRTVVIIY